MYINTNISSSFIVSTFITKMSKREYLYMNYVLNRLIFKWYTKRVRLSCTSSWQHIINIKKQVSYYNTENGAIHFGSYGDANPPIELVSFLNVEQLEYITNSIQYYGKHLSCGDNRN